MAWTWQGSGLTHDEGVDQPGHRGTGALAQMEAQVPGLRRFRPRTKRRADTFAAPTAMLAR